MSPQAMGSMESPGSPGDLQRRLQAWPQNMSSPPSRSWDAGFSREVAAQAEAIRICSLAARAAKGRQGDGGVGVGFLPSEGGAP